MKEVFDLVDDRGKRQINYLEAKDIAEGAAISSTMNPANEGDAVRVSGETTAPPSEGTETTTTTTTTTTTREKADVEKETREDFARYEGLADIKTANIKVPEGDQAQTMRFGAELVRYVLFEPNRNGQKQVTVLFRFPDECVLRVDLTEINPASVEPTASILTNVTVNTTTTEIDEPAQEQEEKKESV